MMARNQPLHNLWKQFETTYKPDGFKFGYRDRELIYSLSVQDERSGRAKISQVEIGLPVIEYGKIWKQLMLQLGYKLPTSPRPPGTASEQQEPGDQSEQAGEPRGDSQAHQSSQTDYD